VHDALVCSLSSTMPKTGGSAWEKKQLSGPLLDEDQLPMYVMGLEQGVPVMRIFKRKKAKEDVKAKVVLAIDESTSMDPEKQRAALEALFAYGDALKAVNPDIEICVTGFSDKVRLHAGFEQEWNDELKAHILLQVENKYQATDDERGGVEGIGLLKMAGAEVGEYIAFSDGQGMPGTKKVAQLAEQEGFGFLTVGIGPTSKGVIRLGDNGCYSRNLNTLATELAQAKIKMWERAGRLVS